MGKASETFCRLKFWLPQNLLLYAKCYAAGRECNTELLIPVSSVKGNTLLCNTFTLQIKGKCHYMKPIISHKNLAAEDYRLIEGILCKY